MKYIFHHKLPKVPFPRIECGQIQVSKKEDFLPMARQHEYLQPQFPYRDRYRNLVQDKYIYYLSDCLKSRSFIGLTGIRFA